MAKVRVLSDLSNLQDGQFERYASQAINDLSGAVNGNLSFDDNLATQTVSVQFNAANTDVAVQHDLDKTGVLYIAASKSAPCDIYTGVGAATKSQIFLRSNTAGVVVNLILA